MTTNRRPGTRRATLAVATLTLLSVSAMTVDNAPALAAYPGDNGRIVFAGDGGFGTWDVITMGADGSDRVNLTPGHFDEEYPAWSPDGTRIAFSRTADSPSGCRGGDVYIMNADGSDLHALTANEFGVAAYDPTWSPNGSEIAFTREHWDAACSGGDVDIWKMNSDGSAQVLLAAGSHDFGAAYDAEPAWSPDGDRIAFRSDRENVDWARNDQIYTMDTDGSNVTQVTHQDFHTFESNESPAWSPDGQQIAFQHFPHRPPAGLGSSQISRINADGSGEIEVTSNSMFNMNPAWSPDGQRILFTTHYESPPGDFNNDIFAIDPDGTDQIMITSSGEAKDMVDWQPIGQPPAHDGTIAWVSAGPAGSFTEDIWTMAADGSNPTNLLPGNVSEGYPELSRDGTLIAFSRSGILPSGCQFGDIFVMDADGSNVSAVTTNPPGIAAFDPTWSPDGQRIAFTRIEQDPVTCSGASTNVWATDVDGTGQVALSNGSDDAEPAWSPDGTRIAFRSIRPNEDGNSYLEIYTMDPDGSNVTRLTDTAFHDPESNENPVWSPDGTRIAFEHIFWLSTNSEIWTMNADGSDETPVTGNGFVNSTDPAWSPDATRIAFSGTAPSDVNNEIYTIDVDGSNPSQLTNNDVIDWMPSWGPTVQRPADLVVTDCADPALAEVTSVAGDLIVDGLATCESLSLPALTEAGGVIVTGNTALEHVNLAALVSVTGDLTISGNASGELILEAVEVSGNLTVIDNGNATVNLAAIAVGGDLTIVGNASGELILEAVEVSGNLTVVDNGNATVSVGGGEAAGDVTIEGQGAGEINLPAASGDLTIDTSGYDVIGGSTAGGTTSISNVDGQALMRVLLQEGTFEAAVAFTITRLDPATLTPEAGTGADSEAASIDPLAAYSFEFAVPVLGLDATLSFDVLLAGLDADTQAALLAALDAGTATLVTKGGETGDTYQAFPLCTGSAVPTADGCVLVEMLDAEGVPTTDPPAIVRFTGVTGHFSTWGVAIVETQLPPLDTVPPIIAPHGDVSAEATGPTGATVGYTEPTATDDVDGAVPVSCAPATVSVFPLGTTTVTCSARDIAGNAAASTFDVVVSDTTAPIIDAPDDITAAAMAPTGAVVTFTATATDTVEGVTPVACTPSSGSLFQVGVTFVVCTATDRAGNAAVPAEFHVTVSDVKPALSKLNDLLRSVEASSIQSGLRVELANKLKAAQKALQKPTPDTVLACDKLVEFARKVELESSAKKSPRIRAELAAPWLAAAAHIRSELGCSQPSSGSVP